MFKYISRQLKSSQGDKHRLKHYSLDSKFLTLFSSACCCNNFRICFPLVTANYKTENPNGNKIFKKHFSETSKVFHIPHFKVHHIFQFFSEFVRCFVCWAVDGFSKQPDVTIFILIFDNKIKVNVHKILSRSLSVVLADLHLVQCFRNLILNI